MARIVFFAHDSPRHVEQMEYYQQDVQALRALGHEVVVCTTWREIPFRFDAMFAWWWTYALVPVLLSKALGRPCIITGTFNYRFPADFPGMDYTRRPLWQRLLIRTAAAGADRNLFVNRLELEQVGAAFGLASGRHYPHCLHDDYLAGAAEPRRLAVCNVSWSGRGNLERKGIPELLEAVRLLKDRGERIEVTLAGLEGDGADWLRGRIRELELDEQVRYVGALSRADKIALMRETEVYAQPSHYEGFGLAILEAMGCGACAIVCDAGAVREVVGDCGVYVPQSSPAALADAIHAVLCDEGRRRALQQAAAARAREQFSFQSKVDRLKGILEEIGVR